MHIYAIYDCKSRLNVTFKHHLGLFLYKLYDRWISVYN